MKTDEELIWEAYEGYNQFKTAFHVTYKENLDRIKQEGINPSIPNEFPDENAVYLFPTFEDLENAIMNWLGDRLDEDKEIVYIKVNISGLNCDYNSDVGYEIRCLEKIDPIRIIDVGEI